MSGTSGSPVLEVRGLSKHFGGLKAVSDLDFVVNEGEILSLIGPNGAGKTTAFNLIARVYPVTKGEILYRGQSLLSLPQHKVTRLGLVRTFQNIKLFSNMTALDNVKVSRYCRTKSGVVASLLRLPWTRREERQIEERAQEMLEFVGLGEKGYEVARSLPYGDQKRLEIARALATDPRMLLLDEPAAGLNTVESDQLVRLIRKIRDDGITIILIEHDMKVVTSISDRIVVLDHGLKICEGTPEYVCRDSRVIEAYLGKAV